MQLAYGRGVMSPPMAKSCFAGVGGGLKVSGLAPTGDPPSLVSPKEPGARNATRGGRPGLSPDCSAVLGLCSRAKLAAFAVLTTLRQVARSQTTWGAARPAAKSCAPRRPPREVRLGSLRIAVSMPGQCVGGRIGRGGSRLPSGRCAARRMGPGPVSGRRGAEGRGAERAALLKN